MSQKEIRIWLLFLLLNTFLFLPRYLMELDSSTFIPYKGFLSGDWYNRLKYFFNRTNYDIIRLNVDLFIAFCAGWYFQKNINTKYFRAFLGFWYVIIFLYLIYYNTFNKIFLSDPLFYNDAHMLSLGFFNTFVGSGWIPIVLLLMVSAFLILLYKMAYNLLLMVKNTQIGRASRLLILVLAFLLLINTVRSGFTFNSFHSFQFTLAGIIQNFKSSIQASHQLKNFNTAAYPYHYQNYKLIHKPNIYLLFIESYGKIVYDNTLISQVYLPTIRTCEHKLDSAGWGITSKLSTSPVSGGNSWISYSSVMYGFNIKNEGTYLSLLARPDIEKFPHLMRFFQLQGYKNYRLNAIPENEKMKIPWGLYSRFYAIDEWIFFKEMNYKGKLYGFGPSPPDQFSLAFAHDYIQKQGKDPFTLFFITQSSHNPFISPQNVATDWRTLNTGTMQKKQRSVFLKKPTVVDYTQAIRYQLLMITDFITKFGTENDLFIIIGDHQPPVVTPGKQSGFETPVHVISKNQKLIDQFSKYKFEKGLEIKHRNTSIKHEGIYSLFMQSFLHIYGDSTQLPPPLLPNGAL